MVCFFFFVVVFCLFLFVYVDEIDSVKVVSNVFELNLFILDMISVFYGSVCVGEKVNDNDYYVKLNEC